MLTVPVTEKFLLALKTLLAAHSIDAENPTLHWQVIRFRQALNSSPTLDPKVAEVLKVNSGIVPASDDFSSFNDSFLSKHIDSASHVQSALRVRQFLNPASKGQNEKDLFKTLELPRIKMDQAEAGLKLLQEWKSEASVKDGYTEAARSKWPRDAAFAKS